MKKIVGFLLVIVSVAGSSVFAAASYDERFGTNTRTQPGYFQNLGHVWGRGLTNIVTSPLEIPYTIAKYHRENPNPPVIKHAAGLTDGIIRVLMRASSGFWDIPLGLIPGDQQGASVSPETLFTKTAD